jgi:hypothetical protein
MWEYYKNSPEKEIIDEEYYYRRLFENMAIEWDFSHGFIWSLGKAERAREIRFSDGRELSLSPADIAVISIGLSLWDDMDSQERTSNTVFIKRLWIINEDNCLDLFTDMISRVRPEHMTNEFFQNIAENQWKLIPLIQAYRSFQIKKAWWSRLNITEKILWWQVMAILCYKYALRLYLVDSTFPHYVSWVDAFDWLFDDFSKTNFHQYLDEGYENMWETFLSIRDEIATKKWLPAKTNNFLQIAQKAYRSLLERMQVSARIIERLSIK